MVEMYFPSFPKPLITLPQYIGQAGPHYTTPYLPIPSLPYKALLPQESEKPR